MVPYWRFSQANQEKYASLVSKLANESKRVKWRLNSCASPDTSLRNDLSIIDHTVPSAMVAAEVSIGQKVVGTAPSVEMIFAVQSATINTPKIELIKESTYTTTSSTLSSN